MLTSFEHWPFTSFSTRRPEEQQRWWAECFYPTQAFEILKNKTNWCIVYGKAGSGRSTLTRAYHQQWDTSAFILEYQPPWKGAPSENLILNNIFRKASNKLGQLIQEDPKLLKQISSSQRDFLRWLTEKFNDPRAYTRWLDGLPLEYDDMMRLIPQADLYPEHTSQIVSGEITELSNLVKRLGFSRVLAIIDMPPFISDAQGIVLMDFLGWLESMHHQNFTGIISVTTETLDRFGLLSRARGRADPVMVDDDDEIIIQLANRHLMAATRGQIKDWEALADFSIIEKVQNLVREEFQTLTAGPLVQISAILLELFEKKVKDKPGIFPNIKENWFKRYMRLRFDPTANRYGVWRGHQFIDLDHGPYEFLEQLWNSRTPISMWAGKYTDYLHTLARRLRVAIEPDPSNPIYLINRRGEGYVLENMEKEA